MRGARQLADEQEVRRRRRERERDRERDRTFLLFQPPLISTLGRKIKLTSFDLLFGQHASVLVSCALYGVARSTGRSVRFRVAERAAATAAPHAEPGVFGADAAELEPPSAAAGPRGVRGEARELYNGPFLDKARDLLEALMPPIAVAEREERVVEETAVEEEGGGGERLAAELGMPKQQQQQQQRRSSVGVGVGRGRREGGIEEDAEGPVAAAAAPSEKNELGTKPRGNASAGAAAPPPPPPPLRRVPLSAMTAADVERRELAARRLERGGVSVAFTPNSKVRYDHGSRGGGGAGGGAGGGGGGGDGGGAGGGAGGGGGGAKASAGGKRKAAPAAAAGGGGGAASKKGGMTPMRG